MQATQAATHYAEHSVATASPANLVLVLYEAVLTSVTAARTSLVETEAPDLAMVSSQLGRAQQIISELELALDHERGGEIARSFQSLYRYSRDRLVEANLSKDPGPLDDVEMVISGLRDAWASSVVGDRS